MLQMEESALLNNTLGAFNTASGAGALYYNTTGYYNTAVGYFSGPDNDYSDLSNTGAFGYNAKVGVSNSIRIGNTSITLIGGAVAWSNFSDGRFKTNVQNNVPGLNFILRLNPVTFSWDMQKT